MAKAKEREKLESELNKHFQKKKWKNAIRVLKELMELGHADSRLRLMLGDLYVRAGKKEEAVAEYSSVAEEYAKQGELIKAIAVNKMIVRISPSHQESHARLAKLYKEQGLAPEVYAATTDNGQTATVAKPVPLFGELNAEEFGEVVKKMILHQYPKNTTVFRQGESSSSLFVISSGKVKVSGRDPNNKEILLAELGDNSFFGEIAALSGKPRIATVTTLEDSDILELHKGDLDEVTKTYPGVGKIIQRFYQSRVEQDKKMRLL